MSSDDEREDVEESKGRLKQVWECVGDTCVKVAHKVGKVANKVSEAANPYKHHIGTAVSFGSDLYAKGIVEAIKAVPERKNQLGKAEDDLRFIREVEESMKQLLKTAKEAPYRVCSLVPFETAVSILSKRIQEQYTEKTEGGVMEGWWPEWYAFCFFTHIS